MIDLAKKGFRQKLGTYIVMTILVAFTVAGYLIVSSYWADAARVSAAKSLPLDFPYIKSTVVHAYLSNPPISNDPDMPSPPRKYVPFFNEAELDRVRSLSGVRSLTVALSQDSFSRFGSMEYLSIEAGSPMWEDVTLVAGSLPSGSQVLIPDSVKDSSSLIGQVINVKVPRAIFPRPYKKDPKITDSFDPSPSKRLMVAGVYKSSAMVSGLIGWLEVRRVDSYPELDPEKVTMEWPVPNTVFLKLTDPAKAHSVSLSWRTLYPEMPDTDVPIVPPSKVEWTPDLPEVLMRSATSDIAMPVFANTFNAFSLGAIGIFASMFMSFLDRRKELGIMKTVGIDGSQIVSTEVVLSGIFGTILGIILAAVTSHFIVGVSGNAIVIPWLSLVSGVTVAGLILACATYVPYSMARQGTVMELLHERMIPIVRKKT